MFELMHENKEEITLMNPSSNDQLFRLFGPEEVKGGVKGGINKDFINSLKTYPEKFKMKIPSRMFVTSSNPNVSKCKDCQTVLTDDYVKLESQPIVDQYEPEDKEALVSVYCDILRNMPALD